MSFPVPKVYKWFLPGIEKALGVTVEQPEELFKFSTEEIAKQFLNKEDFKAHLLVERFFLENITGATFSERLLRLNLKLFKEVKGELFYFPGSPPKNFPFVRITGKIYFYPRDWGGERRLIFSLLKERRKFYSLPFTFKEDTELSELESSLRLVKSLGFQRLGEKALEFLNMYFTREELKRVAEISEHFSKEDGYALGMTSLKEIPFSVKEEVKGRGITLFLYHNGISDIKEALERGGKTGILTDEVYKRFATKVASPFMFAFAAFEHARRLPERNLQVFEGFTYHVMADLFYEWEDYGSSLYWYEVGKDFTEQPVELLLSKPAIHYLIGELEEARALIEEALSYREDPMSHHNLGLVYLQLGKVSKAREHFEKAFEMERTSFYREALASSLWEEGNYKKLISLLEEAEDLSLKEKALLGKAYFVEKKFEKAFALLKEFLSSPKRDGEILFFLAWLYLNLRGDKEVSERLFIEARRKLGEKEYEELLREFGEGE